MIKGTKVLILFLFVSWTSIYSQQLDRQVLVPVAGLASGVSVNYSQTVGETAIVIVSCTDFLFTQGFQQPEDYSLSINEPPAVTGGDVIIYPNPTSGNFTLNYISTNNFETIIKLYDLLGQVVYSKTTPQTIGLNSVSFDISTFNQGIYLLALTTSDSKGENKNTHFHKINLVY